MRQFTTYALALPIDFDRRQLKVCGIWIKANIVTYPRLYGGHLIIAGCRARDNLTIAHANVS